MTTKTKTEIQLRHNESTGERVVSLVEGNTSETLRTFPRDPNAFDDCDQWMASIAYAREEAESRGISAYEIDDCSREILHGVPTTCREGRQLRHHGWEYIGTWERADGSGSIYAPTDKAPAVREAWDRIEEDAWSDPDALRNVFAAGGLFLQ